MADGVGLEYTPTWILAVVCCFIVLISIAFGQLLHHAGKELEIRKQSSLIDALQKVKEELMILGFISLMLSILQDTIQSICVEKTLMRGFLPCSDGDPFLDPNNKISTTKHLTVDFLPIAFSAGRRLLAGGGESPSGCNNERHVPLLSTKAVHELHIFIFLLAVMHVFLSAAIIFIGIMQMRNWERWENVISQDLTQNGDRHSPAIIITHTEQYQFIRWVCSFFKQFYGSITEKDYTAMRQGFINKHCRTHPEFNFYKYMIGALEADFKNIVGISWYLWIFVIIILFLNVHEWHVYFWLSWCPFIILVVIGAKLEHLVTELEHMLETSSDHLFWFGRPKLVLLLIHFILFQCAFQITDSVWILTSYYKEICVLGKIISIIPRLIVSLGTAILCCYSTLPLYVIVSHMECSSETDRATYDDCIRECVRARESSSTPQTQTARDIELTNQSDEPTASTSDGLSLN